MMANRFLDPLYGAYYPPSFVVPLIYSPEMQRLRGIRMCNICSLLLTGASQPSRFEHAIGTLYLAERWAKNNIHDPGEFRSFLSAALIHDFQTAPFGHSFEYILVDDQKQFDHQDVSTAATRVYSQQTSLNAAYKGKTFELDRQLDGHWHQVAALIRGEGKFGCLVSGDIDFDNIDNVYRLAFHMGLIDRESSKGPIKIADNITVLHDRLITTESGAHAIESWHLLRKELYSLLLYDWAEFSAKAMLTRAGEIALRESVLGADSWILTDEEFLNSIVLSKGEAQYAGELVRRIQLGDLAPPILLASSQNVGLYKTAARPDWKIELETRLRVVCGVRVLFHPILDRRKTERSIGVWIGDDPCQTKIGHDSSQLLIGIFSLQPGELDLRAIRNKLITSEVLSVFGPLTDLADPVMKYSSREPAQLELFR